MQLKKLLPKLAMGALLTAALVTPALAVNGTVDTDGSALRMRSEASVAGSVLKKLDDDTVVEVLASTEGGWYHIRYKGAEGYVSGEYLAVEQDEVQALPVETDPVYLKVTTSVLNIRSGPDTSYDKVGKLTAGRIVRSTEKISGWYRIDSGYINGAYVKVTESAEPAQPAEAPAASQGQEAAAFISEDYVEVVDAAEAAQAGKGQEIADYAMQFLGYSYVYGGSTPKSGFDCSGLTSYVYKQFGYSLNRTAANQLDNGVAVDKSALQPGDLVMFRKAGYAKRASHVGIYIGNNQFIHASSPGVGVILNSLDDYKYPSEYVGARRII